MSLVLFEVPLYLCMITAVSCSHIRRWNIYVCEQMECPALFFRWIRRVVHFSSKKSETSNEKVFLSNLYSSDCEL
jgi:hypothetical protein